MILALLAGALIFSIHNLALAKSEVARHLGSEVLAQGVVSSDPSKTKARVFGSRASTPKTTFLMRLETISSQDTAWKSLRVPVRVLISQEVNLFPGMRIEITARVVKSKERKVAALLIGKSESLKVLKEPKSLASLEVVRSALREKANEIGGDSGSLIPGMVIGDTTLQTPEFSKQMLDAGLSHLTAVSGANFAIVSAFLFALIGVAIPNRKVQVITTIFALAIFVLLVRPTPSVLRAAVMTLVFLIAKISGQRNVAVNSLAIAISLLLLINPFQAFEAGFILSVLATSGLIFLAPSIAERIKGPKIVGEMVSIPTAATLFCSPYLMLLSGGLNLSAIPLNIAVAPAVPFVTVFAFLATILVLPIPILADFLLFFANFGASWIVYVSTWSNRAPSFVTSPLLILLFGAAFIGNRYFDFATKVKVLIPITLLLVLFISNQRLAFPGEDWKVGQCDVGQGDALLVNLGIGSAILFDAGPDPRALDRCLDLFRISKLPLIFISHAHADHYQGLIDLKGREIGEIWSNSATNTFGDKPIEIKEVRKGLSAELGEVSLEILWPETGKESFDSIQGDGSGENNRSVVALVTVSGKKLLVTGDIEPGAQGRLLEQLPDLDLIKVPHHGSKFQDLRLFESAEVFLISVGANSYGHPNEGLISHLEQLGQVFRTDKDGAIALAWQGGRSNEILSARLLGKEWWRISWH